MKQKSDQVDHSAFVSILIKDFVTFFVSCGFQKNTIFKALCKVIMFEHLRGNYKRSHLFLWCNYLWDKIFCVKWHTKIAQDSREKMLKLHFLGKNWLLLVFSPLLLGKDDITFDIANVLAITKSHLAARKPISFLISQYISKISRQICFCLLFLIKSLWSLMRKKPAGKTNNFFQYTMHCDRFVFWSVLAPEKNLQNLPKATILTWEEECQVRIKN